MTPFRFLLRVRYSECDAQGIVFNARYSEYVDVAITEFTRAVLGSIDPRVTGIDWRVVQQTIAWRAPARYDDVLDLRVHTAKLGTTSFTVHTELRRGEAVVATAETVYVAVDPAGVKRVIAGHHREALERGAPDVVVDHAGAT